MVTTTEVAQLSRECNAWRETLRSYRDEFNTLIGRLQEVAARQTDKDILCEVEHLDNQLHIQLINIHDLKQAIKNHQRQISSAMAIPGTEDPSADHEQLFDGYQTQVSMLQELHHEFNNFLSQVR
ncbi:MAG: hypothetical protein QM731_04645 [Chitinophagaceae bacterium]